MSLHFRSSLWPRQPSVTCPQLASCPLPVQADKAPPVSLPLNLRSSLPRALFSPLCSQPQPAHHTSKAPSQPPIALGKGVPRGAPSLPSLLPLTRNRMDSPLRESLLWATRSPTPITGAPTGVEGAPLLPAKAPSELEPATEGPQCLL